MLKDSLKNRRLILASGSPRRQQFMRDLGLDFEIRLIDVEEIYPEDLRAEGITNYLAVLKARVFTDLKDDEILITSDTIVWHNEIALGKPKDYDHAFEMLSTLADSTHNVITSVLIKSNQNELLFHDITRVTFSKLTQEEIHYYLKNFNPFDKAGSYGIQDWIGLVAISKIEGSYTNVVGLPTEKFYYNLEKFVAL